MRDCREERFWPNGQISALAQSMTPVEGQDASSSMMLQVLKYRWSRTIGSKRIASRESRHFCMN